MNFKCATLATAIALTASPLTAADVEWDVAVPWGASEFHSVNAINFAARVEEATGV